MGVRFCLRLLCTFFVVGAVIVGVPARVNAGPISIVSGSGANPAAIQAVVDQFRLDLGDPNNGNTSGSQDAGRREVNWDGGGAAAPATVFPTPMNNFNAGGTTRGLVSTTPGTGLEQSGMPSPEFGEINATYPDIFQPFSAPRLFAAIGSNIVDANFFVPGTSTPAFVSGFGAVFTDVDLANTSSLEFFDIANSSLGTFFVSPANNGLSFLGVTFSDPISRVRITSGNSALGPNDGGGVDVVALDDFLYSEPHAVPEPSTVLLLGTALVAVAARGRRASK
jgi:PEP-CTERM motif